MKSKIICAYPCVGKTTLYRKHKEKYLDLEFRETASTRGMNSKQVEELFECYAQIIKNVHETGAYECIFVTDNEIMLKQLWQLNLPFTYVIPCPDDTPFIKEHYKRVLARNDQQWYDNIIKPRNDNLRKHIEWVQDVLNRDICYLSLEKPYLENIIDEIYQNTFTKK